MDEKLFSKKSLDKVKSPESLDDYIRVSNPGVWLLLVSIIVLLIGAVAWGIFGHIDSTVSATVRVENGVAVCYIPETDVKGITEGMTVRFDGKEAVIQNIGAKVNAEYVCALQTDESLTDGFYEAKVVTESYQPLSFVLN